MPSSLPIILMSLSVLLFCAGAAYLYVTWSRETRNHELQKLTLDKIQDDLTQTRSDLGISKIERTQLEKQFANLKSSVDTFIEGQTRDRNTYTNFIERFEKQITELQRNLNALKNGKETAPSAKDPAYQGLFDKLEHQIRQKEAEIKAQSDKPAEAGETGPTPPPSGEGGPPA